MGNRLSSLTSALNQYNNSNELTSDASFTYQYDHNGNLTSKSDSSGGWPTLPESGWPTLAQQGWERGILSKRPVPADPPSSAAGGRA